MNQDDNRKILRDGRTYFLMGMRKVRFLLNLKEDFDEQGCSEIIKSNVEFKSGNAWSLIFAIFIASIGLQANSTAVIIGAMLISPLMGPIVGAGFALGVHDFELLKKSFRNLSYAVVISVVTSTLFFIFTPTSGAQSELLARTQPTFFDVMIAFFGGSAGIVAISRKQKGNAIPGVAIATALMPPLCTAGYGVANLDWGFVLGALYLFLINTAFIFASTYLFVRFLEFSIVVDRNPVRDRLIHKWMTWGATVLIVPSLVMAWYLQRRTDFENKVSIFIEKELNFSNTLVGQKNIEYGIQRAKVVIKTLGQDLSAEKIIELKEKLNKQYRVKDVDLEIFPLEKEQYSLLDLEKRFLTRSEYIQEKESLEQKEMQIFDRILSGVRINFEKKYPQLVSEVNIQKDQDKKIVNVFWKYKVSDSRRSEFDLMLNRAVQKYKILDFEIHHKSLIAHDVK